jgi:uncharacterized protein (UPF0264 family)
VTEYALSLKQPWAALLVHGLKTIEVRNWPTARRGRVLIHAAQVPDDRAEAGRRVPPELRDEVRQLGGIIGAATLVDCKTYRSREAFAADQALHHNEPGWFVPPVLYGFVFTGPAVLPFRPCGGQVRFFRVDGPEALPPGEVPLGVPVPARPAAVAGRSGLLVSVRGADEVEAALAGGAALIDVKEPRRGALGRAGDETIAEVAAAVAGRLSVSAALGELRQAVGLELPAALDRLAFVKWGLAGYPGQRLAWRMELDAAVGRLRRVRPECRFVAVAYADWEQAGAPAPTDVCTYACDHNAGALLLDTWHKDGSTLLNHLDADTIGRLAERCRAADVKVALAGSLGAEEIERLRAVQPDWFAVRGSVCRGGRRQTAVDEGRVRRLAELVQGGTVQPVAAGEAFQL